MRRYLTLFFLFILVKPQAQQATVVSFQHALRWVNESNFPNYIGYTVVRDSIFLAADAALKKKFGVTKVQFPDQIEYRYYDMFGKPSLKWPKSDVSKGDFEVAFLSWITRATVGYNVIWKMEIMVRRDGQTHFSQKTEHELEYFSPAGYMTQIPWMDAHAFTRLFEELLGELLGSGTPLDNRITIGSVEEVEEQALRILPNASKYQVKTSGGFLTGGSFGLLLGKDKDTISNVIYKDGWESSYQKNPLSEVAAGMAESILGVPILYTDKRKEKRFGKLLFSNGGVRRLRLEWVSATERNAKGDIEGPTHMVSPMVGELYKGDLLLGYFTFYQKDPRSTNQNQVMQGMNGGGIIYLKGVLNDIPLQVDYDPSTSLIEVSSEGITQMIIILINLNPESRSFSGEKLSKNKKLMSSGTGVGKPRFKDPEWYWAYAKPGIGEVELNGCLEAVLCMFFGLGNGK